MKYRFIYITIIAFLVESVFVQAQIQGNIEITITGHVVDSELPGLFSDMMIVNKRTGTGIFADSKGSFRIRAYQTDSILIAAQGYHILRICFRDSVSQESYDIPVRLRKLNVELPSVEIFSKRNLSEIEQDISKLGYNREDYMLSGINAFQSPITYLFQMYNKTEKNKRKVAELRNDDRKRALLHELFSKYVNDKIINLTPAEFDDFIDFCRVPEDFMKSSTQYEFIMFIKEKYSRYHVTKK